MQNTAALFRDAVNRIESLTDQELKSQGHKGINEHIVELRNDKSLMFFHMNNGSEFSYELSDCGITKQANDKEISIYIKRLEGEITRLQEMLIERESESIRLIRPTSFDSELQKEIEKSQQQEDNNWKRKEVIAAGVITISILAIKTILNYFGIII